MNPWLKSKWAKITACVFIGALGVMVLIYQDLVHRSKDAYLEGEKYMRWHESPAKKKEFIDAQYETSKAKLDQLLSAQKLTQDDYQEQVDALAFDRDFAMEESSLKYAYQWYKDAYELFSPPESKWAQLARARAPEALALWKQELREQKVSFEDTMFE